MTEKTLATCSVFLFLTFSLSIAAEEAVGEPPHNLASIQSAIDDNPGGTIRLRDVCYKIDAPITITGKGIKLIGPATIVQTNPDFPIIRIDGARDVLLRDLSLTRAAEAQKTDQPGIVGTRCANVDVDRVAVNDNHGGRAAIFFQDGERIRIERCEIVNYKYIGIDDRVDSPRYGIAFRCINGAGIALSRCRISQILNNRVLEHRILPTRETVVEHHLGEVVKRSDAAGSREVDGAGWHQGSAIEVHDAQKSSHSLLQGNYVENAAQGFDIHADSIVITANHVNTCHTGIKTMHGGRHVLITANIVERADDEGIYLGSNNGYRARPAEGGQPPISANTNNGCIVSGNVISEMGYGLEGWVLWRPGVDSPSPMGIKIMGIGYDGDLVRDDFVITGNIVYHSGPDGMIQGNEVRYDRPPHYKWALWIQPEAAPLLKNVRIVGNIFHPGEFGVANVPLSRWNSVPSTSKGR